MHEKDNVDSIDDGCVRESVVENTHEEEETMNKNEEKQNLDKIQEDKGKNCAVVGDDNGEQISQEQSLHDVCHDQVDDCNNKKNADVCNQDDNQDDVNYHSNSDDDDGCDDDDDDDDDGWITPENINQVKADYGVSETQSRPTDIAVGCLTTDFAMQVKVKLLTQ